MKPAQSLVRKLRALSSATELILKWLANGLCELYFRQSLIAWVARMNIGVLSRNCRQKSSQLDLPTSLPDRPRSYALSRVLVSFLLLS